MDNGMRLLHPMMPFISEELYQKLPKFVGKAESIAIAKYPEYNPAWEHPSLEKEFDCLYLIVKTIRSLSSSVNLHPSIQPKAFLIRGEAFPLKDNINDLRKLICVLSKASEVKYFFPSLIFFQLVILPKPEEVPGGCTSDKTKKEFQIYVQVKEYINIPSEVQIHLFSISPWNRLIG